MFFNAGRNCICSVKSSAPAILHSSLFSELEVEQRSAVVYNFVQQYWIHTVRLQQHQLFITVIIRQPKSVITTTVMCCNRCSSIMFSERLELSGEQRTISFISHQLQSWT